MALHQPLNELKHIPTKLVVQTDSEQWVVPRDCELIKLLFRQLGIDARDLRFGSAYQCHVFTKSLFLLAAQDECMHQRPSELASIARELMSSEVHTVTQRELSR